MANIQIFGFKKCKNTRKAERFFSERGVSFQFVDLSQKSFSEGELKSIVSSCCDGDAENLLDKTTKAWEKSNLSYMRFDPFETIIEKPELIKTPVVRRGKRAFIGAEKGDLQSLIED
ncbi:MAG: glutaredoxin [Candidatus Cloacimonadota bacterium]|nr:MAG: glutaredoxin [Candidatus Cloacimonadota bacterium]PIE77754.1 MAG: glutaredoxin [Candidatus Delongbacteria bacterium]